MNQTMKQKVRRRRIGDTPVASVRSRDSQERLIGRARKLIRSIDELVGTEPVRVPA